MLSQEAFSFWCQQSGLSEQTQAVIQQVRSSDPARRVGGGEHNVSGRYPSRKMGFTIQFESHRVELAFVHEMEHDPDVLEFYDQPPSFMLDYEGKQGRRLFVKHTPDYFVIRNQTAGWIECKTEEELLKLGEKSPNRYCRNDDGRWHCPPGESYAAQFGLSYRVRSSREVNWVFQRNIQFLEDYLRSNAPLVTSDARAAVLAHVAPTTGITLADLFCKLGGTATRDDVYALIAIGGVYVNLRAVPIVEPEKLRVFQSREVAAAYERVVAPQCAQALQRSSLVDLVGGGALTWDGRVWVIGNTGQTAISLLGQDGALVDLPHATFEELIKRGAITGITHGAKGETRFDAGEQLAPMTPGGLEEANRRYKIIQPYLNGERVKEPGAPARTIYRWLARYRTAETTLGTGYLGLLPHHHECGNRRRRVSEETQKLMAEFIDQQYETVKQKRKFEVYGSLALACESQGTIPPSYKTFTREIKRRPCYEQTLKRKGRRAAYPYQPCYLELELTTPRHGEFPFQIGHIDHTELDVELLCSVTGRNLGRPWLTILTDAFSRRFLAVFLTYDPPSYRSCMMVLRECVRRHGRLPQTIVVDGGREFGSLYFETLLARYECTKKTRPPAKARFGAVCERLFGTSNTQFVHNLAGNTQVTKNVRQVTQSVNPKNHAVWTIGKLHERFCEWAYEVYDQTVHPALGQSPHDTFASGLGLTGQRLHRWIAYDDEFRLMTLPTTAKGTASVFPAQGVKINHIFYWSNAFRDPAVERTQVPVRYDPYDAGIAYTFVRNHWVECISQYYASFQGRSEREILLATTELRKRNQVTAKRFVISAKRLADFLSVVEHEEDFLVQRLRAKETKTGCMTVVARRPGQDPASNSMSGSIDSPELQSQMLVEKQTPQIECTKLNPPQIYEEY